MFLTAVLFTAFGTAIASVLEDMQGFQLIMNFVVMPIFFLSGALFPLQGLPDIMTVVARLDPLSYAVDGLRGSLSVGVHFGMAQDLAVLSALTLVLLGIGSYLFSKIEV
jgi:ABC-2 type transport system permease protein